MKKQVIMMILAGFVLAPVYGVTLLDENFESDTAGKKPEGWRIKTQGKSTVSVVEENAVDTTGSHAVTLLEGQDGNNLVPSLLKKFDAGNDTLKIEFDYMFANAGANPALRLLASSNYATTIGLSYYSGFRVGYNSGGTILLGTGLSPNTWYHFTITINEESRMTIHVIDSEFFEETHADLPLRDKYTTGRISGLSFFQSLNGLGGEFSVDNVKVTSTL